MSASHTMGPWEVIKCDGTLSIMPSPDKHRPDTMLGIASVYDFDGERPDGITQANARLIAAAPDLLDALKRLTVQMNNLLMVADVPERFAAQFNDGQRQAEAAIAKAEGKQ